MAYWSPGRYGLLCFFHLEGKESYPKKTTYLWSKDGMCCPIFPLLSLFFSPFLQNPFHSIINCWDVQAAHGKLSAVLLIPTVWGSILFHLLSSLKSYKFCIAVSWGGEKNPSSQLTSEQNSYFSSCRAGEAAMTPLFSLEEGSVGEGKDNTLAESSIQHTYSHFCLCLGVYLHHLPSVHQNSNSYTITTKKRELVTVSSCAWCMYWNLIHSSRLYLLDSEINSVGEWVCHSGTTRGQKTRRSEQGESDLVTLSLQPSVSQAGWGSHFRQLAHGNCLTVACKKHLTGLTYPTPKPSVS